MLTVACCQMTSGSELDRNMDIARSLIRKASLNGAELAVLPELFAYAPKSLGDTADVAEEEDHGPIQAEVKSWAKEFNIAIAGSFPLKSPEPGHFYNSCLVFNQFGGLMARYDKIHLFEYSNEHEKYEESKFITAGSEPVTFLFPLENGLDVKIGLSVCYDLRFPELYRKMGEPDLVLLPSAFTVTTGQAHWETLIRARAIENLCCFAASGTSAANDSGRQNWGHSMFVDPWGHIKAELNQEETGVCFGNVDMQFISRVRESLPCLKGRKIK